MRVLGIDPGLNVTGYGIVDDSGRQLCLIEAGIIRTKAKRPLETRLAELYDGLAEVADEYKPDIFSVEDLYAHYNHPRTAVIMGHARGVLFLVAGKNGTPVQSYSATNIKKSLTGSGHASKEQIAAMVSSVLSCETGAVKYDVTDAIAAAICHINVCSHTDLRF